MPLAITRENLVQAAQESAERVVDALGGGGLAASFVRTYSEKHRRPALVAHPARHRELIERINREALLAMAARLERDLPRRLDSVSPHGHRGAQQYPERAAFTDHFRVEFYARLAEQMDWRRDDLEDFWRDLDLYTRAARTNRRKNHRHRARGQLRDRHLGAFADRCAFLLDSSLLSRARRAAARLHRQLEREAMSAVRNAFRNAGIARVGTGVPPRATEKLHKRKKPSGKNERRGRQIKMSRNQKQRRKRRGTR